MKAQWGRIYVPFGACLLLCLWLFIDSAQRAPVGPTRLLPLFASLVLAALSLILLGIRSREPLACILSVYLMALGVLARDNMAGLSELAPFATDLYRPQETAYRPVYLVWVLCLGAAPLLFAWLYTKQDRPTRPRQQNQLTALSLILGFAFVQTVCIYQASRGGFGIFALTALAQRLHFPQHQLLIYATPVLMVQQLGALWLLWRHYQRWGENRNRALFLSFGIAALFVALVVINNSLVLPLTGIISNLCAYSVPLMFVWAVERYALFDIQVTIRRVVQYALARQILAAMTFGPLVALAFFLGLWFNPSRNLSGSWLDLHQTLSQQGTLLCSILVGIFAFMLAIRTPLLGWFDRTYFREVYDAQETLNRIGRSLVGLSDSREIARRALEGIDSVLHPLNAMILGIDENGVVCLARRNYTGYRPPAQMDTSLLRLSEAKEIASEGPNALTRASWALELPDSARVLLNAGQIRLLIPLREEEKTTGVLLLGEKASGMAYAPEDVEIMLALASQISLALQSARLNQEFLRRGTQELKDRSADFIADVERERRLLAADLHDQTLPELRALLADLETLAEQQTENHGEHGGHGEKLENHGGHGGTRRDSGERQSTDFTDFTDKTPEHRNTAIENPTPDDMADHLRTTIANIRDMMESLRPSALEMLGLMPALESELRKATGRARPPLIPQFVASDAAQAQKLNAFEEVSVFRIMQEAVNNACRHANARTVRVEVDMEGEAWRLSVEDDGTGLPPEEGRHQGHGLDNIRYRAGLIGASVHWSVPESGRGTRIELRLPLRRRMASLSTPSPEPAGG